MTSSTLIAEATRRSGVVWVSPDGREPRLVWHLWHLDALYLVGGGDEQELPPLEDRAVVVVRSRASQSDRVVEWTADVSPVLPGTARWDEVVPLLAAERLNTPVSVDLPARWAAGPSVVLRLAPTPDQSRPEQDGAEQGRGDQDGADQNGAGQGSAG